MKKHPPSVQKRQAIQELLHGPATVQGSPLLSELVRRSTELVVQELLEAEQAEYLGRDRYERHTAPRGRRNGYEERRLKTGEGVLTVKVPQVRDTPEPYQSRLWQGLGKTSEVLEQIVTEMWVRGLSVRDVEEAMLTAMGAFVLSDTSVSRVTEHLVAQYEGFRKRDLSSFDVAYLFIDAVYEPLRRHGSKLAVLCAWGICTDGSKVLLSLAPCSSESEAAYTDFLRDMARRGLGAPLTITTDGAPGLTNAVDLMWPRSWRIRCWFHKMQNLQAKVPPAVWPEFKARVVEVRDAASADEARERLQAFVSDCEREFPEACRCLQEDSEASLNHLRVPPRHRRLVRTTNLVERAFVEERRRTKIVPHLWDEHGAVKLVFAVLIRVSERWARRQFSQLEEQQLRQLRRRVLGDDEERSPANLPSPKRRSAGHVAA